MVPAHSFTIQVGSGSKEHCLDGAWRITKISQTLWRAQRQPCSPQGQGHELEVLRRSHDHHHLAGNL